jgi:AraC family transcriptional activator of pobA
MFQEFIVASDGGTISVSSLLQAMRKEFEARNSHRKDMLNLLLNTILILTTRLAGFSDEKKETEQDNFNFIIHYLNSKSHIGIDIEETAKMSGLSYHRFRHRFKELTGTSPQQYIIIQRINFAKKMLESTKYNTTSIALACGFHSVPQFITCFNKQEGQTPVKYRRQYLCKKSIKV